MSLLSICQGAVQDSQLSVPATIANNPDATAVMLLKCANRAVRSLMKRPQEGWVAMQTEYTFQTVSITTTGGIITQGSPIITGITPNTTGLVANTFYISGQGFPNNTTIQSVDSSSQVTMNQNATGNFSGAPIVFGQADYPLPSDFSAFVDNTLWDRSRFWSMRGPLNAQQWQVFKSSVIGKATIQRRWRVRRIGSVNLFCIDPVPTDNGSNLVFEYTSNSPVLSSGGVPQTMFQADTDTSKLDEDVLELAVKWRILDRLGMDFSAALDEYEREADAAQARDGGAGILNLAPEEPYFLIGPWQVPESGYGV